MLRKEFDNLGMISIQADALHGIHTERARENFKLSNRNVHPALIQAMIQVKKACALANRQTNQLPEALATAIINACDQLLAEYDGGMFYTDALQGGAGTSTNMCVNEVIANKALLLLNKTPGDYHLLHPIDHVNLSQSTNDVYPTALRIAAITKVRELADELAKLQTALQDKEETFSNILKLGRTQLMDALPVTLGQEFGAYARAISRDRWRIYKVEERLREVGIGGTAVGTGVNATTAYIYAVTAFLQDITGYGIARSDLLIDTMQNMDVFVEVSGFLKALASSLIKQANDIRLMSSGPIGGLGELILEPLQAGSSIMPGKVNPVICEMVIQGSLKVIGNDTVITQAAYLGQLELNPFIPLIADSLLESFDLLIQCVHSYRCRVIETLKANEDGCRRHVELSGALAAALIQDLGYDTGAYLAKKARETGKTVRSLVVEEGFLTQEEADTLLNVRNLTRPKTGK